MSQNVKDSTLFYYESITKVKDVKITSKAFDFFEKKADESLFVNDTISAAYYLELVSLGQFNMGLLYDCESTTIRAFTLLDAIKKDPESIIPRKRLFNQLGMLYRKIEDYDNSSKYYNQALELNEGLADKIPIINNIANIYADQAEYGKALRELYKYYDEVFVLENTSTKATYIDNIGYYQSKIGNPMALKNIESALKIRINIEDLTGLFSSYRHLSLYYSDRGNIKEAIKYSKIAKTISDSLNIPEYQKEALKLNLKLENNLDFQKYLELTGNIEKANQLRENKFAAIKYNVSEKEKIINERELMLTASELQKEKEKRLKLIYLFSGLFVLLLSFFLILFLKNRHKKEKDQQVYTTETRISKKVHDELANDMSGVMSFVENNIEVPANKKSVLLNNLEDLYIRTRDISTETASIDLAHFSESLKHLLMQHHRKGTKIITNNIDTINWSKVSDHKKMAVFRSVQELLVNMKKHSQAKVVSIVFKEDRRKKEILYSDDGIGVSIEDVKLNGLQNVESRIHGIGGSFNFITSKGNGFKAILKFNS